MRLQKLPRPYHCSLVAQVCLRTPGPVLAVLHLVRARRGHAVQASVSKHRWCPYHRCACFPSSSWSLMHSNESQVPHIFPHSMEYNFRSLIFLLAHYLMCVNVADLEAAFLVEQAQDRQTVLACLFCF